MRVPSLMLPVALLLGVAALGTFGAGCAAEDVGADSYYVKKPKAKTATGTSSSSSGDTTAVDEPTDTTDAGRNNGPSTPVMTTNAFTGAPAYSARTGSSARKNAHSSAFGTTNPAGHDCMTCHNGSRAPTFVLGGTVFTTAQGGQGAAGVEVRLSGAQGQGVSVYTDNDGNFYSASNATLPALAGVRNGSATHTMTTPATGGCNGCHNGTTQAVLSVQ